eukprot:scaffold75606_cov51-Phaeocystis_antarctica.AAC.1
MTAFQRGAVGRVVCQFCLKIAHKPLKNLPGLRPGPAGSTHLWTSTPSVWTPRRGPEFAFRRRNTDHARTDVPALATFTVRQSALRAVLP